MCTQAKNHHYGLLTHLTGLLWSLAMNLISISKKIFREPWSLIVWLFVRQTALNGWENLTSIRHAFRAMFAVERL